MREKGGKPPAAGAKARDAKKKKEKGGARSFVTSAEDLEHRNMIEQQKVSARKARRADGEEGSGDEDSDEDDSDSDGEGSDANENVVAFERVPQKSLFGFSQSADGPAMEAKPKKKTGVAGVIKVENPNLKPAQNKVMKAKDMTGDVEQQLSRREREAIEKERAAARYLKKHLAGETDEAKKDLARLQEVKRRREEADQRKKEEEAAAAERSKTKKKEVEKDDDEPLDARAIKALKPNVLKDYLKDRNLSTQGQKKDLIQRLIDYENEHIKHQQLATRKRGSMERMNAEIVANVIGEKVLQSLEQEEQALDAKIKRLERADDDELERLREHRVQQMKQRAFKAQELRAKGHGEFATLTDTKEFFDVMKKSDKIVVHFFTAANAFCELVDGHLERIAKQHIETRFVRMNAEKSEFLVDKLGVWMIPCIALVKDQKVVKMVQGLDELGGTDKFTTAFLAYFIGLHEVLKYDGTEPEGPLDSCGGAYMGGNQAASRQQTHEERLNSIRQSIYYDSDLEEEDDD